jgi:hypothetical protein
MLSETVNSELIGNIVISSSHIEESRINWNNVENMQVCKNIVSVEVEDEETGEIEVYELAEPQFINTNDELYNEWEMSIAAFENNEDIHTEDEEADMYFNENRKNRLTTEEAAEALLKEVVDMENYYKRLMGEVFYSILTAVLIAGKE